MLTDEGRAKIAKIERRYAEYKRNVARLFETKKGKQK